MPQHVVEPPAVMPDVPGLEGAAAAVFTPKRARRRRRKPTPFDQDEPLLKLFERAKLECLDNRWIYERLWWRNLLYVMNRQWIYYDVGRNTWLDKRMAKWVPRPVTNYMDQTVETVLSVFRAVQLSAKTRPVGTDAANAATAATADKLERPLFDEHQMTDRTQIADFWLIVTGNVFHHVYWDKMRERGAVEIPRERCPSCGDTFLPAQIVDAGNACPSCGTPGLLPSEEITRFQLGGGATDVCSPFEICFPPNHPEFDTVPVLLRMRWRTKWVMERLYPTLVPNITWQQGSSERSLQLLRALNAQSDIGNTSLAYIGGDTEQNEGITEFELWVRPTDAYPEGALIRVLDQGPNGMLIRDEQQGIPGPLPNTTQDGNRLWPWVHTPYKRFGGRIWGRSILDTIVQKNDQINQLDSLMQLMIQRTSNPVWILPRGSEVKKFTGEPGLIVRYANLTGGASKPERIAGQEIPQSLMAVRSQYVQDIETLAGTYDVLSGGTPPNVEAYSALQLLVERAQSRYAGVLLERGRSFQAWYRLALELERQYGREERIRTILGPNGMWTHETFKNADLQGSVEILVEDGSQLPKTSLGKRAAIEQLSGLGAINLQNPETAYAVLRAHGQTDLWPGLDAHVQSALREQHEWEQWAQQVQFTRVEPQVGLDGVPMFDPFQGFQPSIPPPGQAQIEHNHEVHLEEHMKWAVSDSVVMLVRERLELRVFLTWFLEQHQLVIEQRMLPPPEATGGAAPGAGAAQALATSNRESEATSTVPSGSRETTQNQGPR